MNIKNIIKEEVDKFLLKEYMAVWRNDAVTQLAHQIANDFAPLNMKTNINRDKNFKAKYSLYLGDTEIPIMVIYTINGEGWRGVYHRNAKDIVLNLGGRITARNVLSGLYHEITHAIDARNEEQLKQKVGYYYGENYISLTRVRSTTCEIVNSILYRLWTFTERNAYQSHSLFGIDYCKDYLNDILRDIQYLETHTNKNEDIIFNELRDRLSKKWESNGYSYKGNKRALNSNWKAFKRFFIKKSYALFEKFSKKLLNNAYKAQEDGLVVTLEPNENSEVFKAFKKENDSIEAKKLEREREREQLRQIRIKKSAVFLKELSSYEDEVLEDFFTKMVQNLCEEKYSEKACCQTEPDEKVKRNCAFNYYESCYFSNEKLGITKNKHGYNLDFYLVFNGSNDSQFAIEDYNEKYEIDIYSKDFNEIMIDIISKSIVYELKGSLYDIWYNKKIMFNEINRRKSEIILLLKKLLHELYGYVFKKEYTLSLKLKDREVNLSAPSREELAVKLRNEFPKWNDAVINNWVNKASVQ
jgi:hypothetical protein